MARPRIRNGPIEHATRRGYQKCVLRPEGACDPCKDANSDYLATLDAERRGLQPPTLVSTPDVERTGVTPLATKTRVQAVPNVDGQPGPVEESVIAELAGLPAARRMQSTAAAAIAAAQDIDHPQRWSAHASLIRQLESAMVSLRKASSTERKGNLYNVASMAQRRTADTAS